MNDHRCTCGHIELGRPGRYWCNAHGENIVGNQQPSPIHYLDLEAIR